MKTTIGIIQSGQNAMLETVASEFFGVLTDPQKKTKKNLLWLTFPSKAVAQEFSKVVDFRCVDAHQKTFH